MFINFIDRRKGIRETYSIFFILISIFGDHRGISSLTIRVVVVPRGRPRNFLLYFNLEAKRSFRGKEKIFFPSRKKKKEEVFVMKFEINSKFSKS